MLIELDDHHALDEVLPVEEEILEGDDVDGDAEV